MFAESKIAVGREIQHSPLLARDGIDQRDLGPIVRHARGYPTVKMVALFYAGVDAGRKDAGHHAEGSGLREFPVFKKTQALLAVEVKKLLNQIGGGKDVVGVAFHSFSSLDSR